MVSIALPSCLSELNIVSRTHHYEPCPDRPGVSTLCVSIIVRVFASPLLMRMHRNELLSLDHVKVVIRAQEKFLTEFAQIRS